MVCFTALFYILNYQNIHFLSRADRRFLRQYICRHFGYNKKSRVCSGRAKIFAGSCGSARVGQRSASGQVGLTPAGGKSCRCLIACHASRLRRFSRDGPDVCSSSQDSHMCRQALLCITYYTGVSGGLRRPEARYGRVPVGQRLTDVAAGSLLPQGTGGSLRDVFQPARRSLWALPYLL